MSSWLLLAVIGHLSNAVAFIIDKALLTTTIKRSATYAALIGGFSLITLIATPWVNRWPSAELWFAIIPFGGLFVLALWAFFEALKHAEATRVVPTIGSLVPIFTLIETYWFLGERLAAPQLVGFLLLLLATWLLTSAHGTQSPSKRANFFLPVLSAFLFATAAVFGKYAYSHGEFLAVFISSRVIAGIVGILIGLAVTSARQEIWMMLHPTQKQISRHAPIWAMIGQSFGACGFVLIHLSIAQGSATIVNALQAVQYTAIALIAWLGGKKLRALLNEERTPYIVVVKSIAIVLVAVGLGLISFSVK